MWSRRRGNERAAFMPLHTSNLYTHSLLVLFSYLLRSLLAGR
jgi:hypothetical protein